MANTENAQNAATARAERLDAVIQDQHHEALKRRTAGRQKTEREETRDIVDDFENPRERAARYRSMDDYNEKIRQTRLAASIAEAPTPPKTPPAPRGREL